MSDGSASIEHVRTDTTVTECNIHWPTDSRLLWDTYHMNARIITRAREIRPSFFKDKLMAVWQRWRALIEGTISCLKRAFRLARCSFRGFKNFASAVGSAVFYHNLRILAKTSGGLQRQRIIALGLLSNVGPAHG